MRDFRMKLQAEKWFSVVFDGGELTGFRRRQGFKMFAQILNLITVAHPGDKIGGDA